MPTRIAVPRYAGFALIALFASGCATLPANEPKTADADKPVAVSPEQPSDAANEAETSAGDEAAYPKQALTRELLFGMLVGDVAALEGDRQLGAETWLEVAKRSRDPRAARRALELAITDNRYDLALSAANLWQSIEPDALPPRQTLLTLYARGNRMPDAEAELDHWLTQRPKDAATLLLEMHTLWPPEADKQVLLAMAKRLTARAPDLPESHMALAMALRDAGDNEQAEAEADLAIRARPDWEAAILYRSGITQTRSASAAIDYLTAAEKRLPTALDIKLTLARLFSDEKRYAEARARYAALAKAKPEAVEFPVGEALASMQLHDYPTARKALERALQLKPKRLATLRYYLGVIAEEEGDLVSARNDYRDIDDPEFAVQTATRLTHVEARLGNKDAALAALAKLPDDSDANQVTKLQVEAQIWRELKDFPRAKAVLDQGLTRHAGNADLLYDRSLIADLMGDATGAERDLRQYLAQNPESPLALNALGYTLANRTNRLDEAEGLIRKALDKEPTNPVIMDSMGWVLVKRGQLGDAIKWLGDAFKAMPDPEIAAHYGEALWRDGQQDAAKRIWAAGLKLDPQHDVLSETMHRLTGR